MNLSAGRCDWAGTDALNCEYHDREWGVPVRAENRLFEMLTLEGAQAGLSWLTILRTELSPARRLHSVGQQPSRTAILTSPGPSPAPTQGGSRCSN